jgi:hypothetical protein
MSGYNRSAWVGVDSVYDGPSPSLGVWSNNAKRPRHHSLQPPSSWLGGATVVPRCQSGKANYRLRIRSASPDWLVFDSENISTMRYWLMPLFQAGDLQSIYFLERESQEVWRYYGIARTSKNANTLTSGHDASFINRAVAFYRYLAGIPTDKEHERKSTILEPQGRALVYRVEREANTKWMRYPE